MVELSIFFIFIEPYLDTFQFVESIILHRNPFTSVEAHGSTFVFDCNSSEKNILERDLTRIMWLMVRVCDNQSFGWVQPNANDRNNSSPTDSNPAIERSRQPKPHPNYGAEKFKALNEFEPQPEEIFL